MTRVFVTRRLPLAAHEHLSTQEGLAVETWQSDGPPPYRALQEAVKSIEGLLCLLTDRVDEDLLGHAGSLRVVSTMSVGYDHIDVQACRRRGIAVGHTPGVLTDATADFTMGLILTMVRRIPEAAAEAREGRWTSWSPTWMLGLDLSEAVVGVVGLGRIGKAVARRAKAFGARLLYSDREDHLQTEADLAAEKVELDDLLAKSDVVTLHVPLTTETHHMISTNELRRMKPNALLVNTSRGPVVDAAALKQALRMGWIGAAALDVTDPEPLPPEDELYQLPNCLVTPHIASAGMATRTRMGTMAVDNLLAGLRCEPLPYPLPASEQE